MIWVLSVGILLLLVRMRMRVRILEDRLGNYRKALESLTLRLMELEGAKAAGAPAAAASPVDPVSDVAAATPVVEAIPLTPVTAAPDFATGFQSQPLPVELPPTAADASPAETAPLSLAELSSPAASGDEPAPPPPPPRPTMVLFPRSSTPIDWEGLVGVKLFSWIAGIALVFAAVFFLRYSIDHGWLSPPIRVAIGLLTGVGLLLGCELRAARRYPVTANALDGAGIATLFATLFAAHALWHLIGTLPTFVLMALVAAVAVALSIRRDSVFIALLGLLGGFATPILLSTGENRPIGLFSYLLVLNVGLAWVAYRKDWVVLTVGSAALTAVYQWGWMLRYLDQSPLPLAMAIFLLFPVVQVGGFVLAGRERAGRSPLFAQTAAAGATLPLAFALYLAAVPAYGTQTSLLFGFVLMVGAGLALVAAAVGPAALHLLGAAGTVIAFVVWCALSYSDASWSKVQPWVAAGVALYLAAPWLVGRAGWSLGAAGSFGRLAAAALLVVPAFLAWQSPAGVQPLMLFGVLFVMTLAIGATSVASGEAGPHLLAALLVVTAEAGWSSAHLVPERLLTALTIYAVFGLLNVGVPMLAARRGTPLRAGPGFAVTVIASIALVLFLAIGPVATASIWCIGLLLAVLTALLFVPAVSTGFAGLRLAGVLASWFVLGTWWSMTVSSFVLLPALVVLAGLGLVIAAGTSISAARSDERESTASLALCAAVVVHLFVMHLVTRVDLAFPPWPWIGVLAVVDLAIATGALAIRDGRAWLAAVVATQLAVLLWQTDENPPWSSVTMITTDAFMLAALACVQLARRRGAPTGMFAAAAVAAALLAQLGTNLAPFFAGPPWTGWLVAEVVLVSGVILAVADGMGWQALRLLAAVSASLAAALWVLLGEPLATWPWAMLFSMTPFVVFTADAFRCAAQSRSSLAALQAAAGSGVVAVVLARDVLTRTGLDSFLGLVPAAMAVVMFVLLRRVRAARPAAGEASVSPAGNDGLVALAAAATLGFATVAIPLQLANEYLTAAWALEAAALAWLYGRIRFAQLLPWVAGVSAVVFVRLAFNPWVLDYHPRSMTPIFNWYLYVYLVSAASLFAAAWFVRDADDPIRIDLRLPELLAAAATVLLFLLLNLEIADYYSTGSTLTFNFLSSSLAQDLSYTIGWALFAIGLLAAGIRSRSRPARVAALALLVVTIVKCFLHDLWSLGGLYRVGSFVGLAICLALVAVLLQRFVFLPKEEAA